MRAPFAYESNAPLLRQLLVPDPLPAARWAAAEPGWRADGGGGSLLEWLVACGELEEWRLLAALGQALGAEVRARGEYEAVAARSPEEQLLANNGFLVLLDAAGRRLVAGGPDLPPRLERYLGERPDRPQWVVISPLREAADGAVAEARAEAADAYGLADWLRELIAGLQARGAADLHFERTGQRLRVRMHRGGAMVAAGAWEGERAHGCLRLLKLWAGLSTAADPLPQDGRILVAGGGRIRPFRISHLVTVDGESAVLRVLGTEDEVRGLEALGMPAELRGLLLDCVANDPGLVLFTGPTGSGKTTTLYGLLKEVAATGLKVLTIEDPVEYEIAAAVQSAVNEAAGWTFDAAVRAYLRQDPDVLVLGEMRDRASAEAACRAALTGHSVLATLHAADAESAAARLASWGIPHGTVAEALHLVVNQRLVADGPGATRRAVYTYHSKYG